VPFGEEVFIHGGCLPRTGGGGRAVKARVAYGRQTVCEDGGMSGWDQDPDEGRAPICPYCGVTALPAELSHVLDTSFICDNADCDAYGEPVGT
jgi:hypothetical protein